MPTFLLVLVALLLIYWLCASVYCYRRFRERNGPFGPDPVLPSLAFAVFVGPIFLPTALATAVLIVFLDIEPHLGIGSG